MVQNDADGWSPERDESKAYTMLELVDLRKDFDDTYDCNNRTRGGEDGVAT